MAPRDALRGFGSAHITTNILPIAVIIGIKCIAILKEEWQGRKLYTFDLVQEWMRDGIYKTEGFITHRFPLSRYKDAMRLAISNPSDMIKIVLDCRKS